MDSINKKINLCKILALVVFFAAALIAVFFGQQAEIVAYADSPLEVEVVWVVDDEYIFSGQPQGPTASVVLGDTTVSLDVYGYGADKGNYTAQVSNTIAGYDNFVFTGTQKEYTILALEVVVDWQTEAYIFNGLAQGPTAKFTNANGHSIGLTVTGWGTQAGTHDAKVAEDAAGSNYTLKNRTKQYEILPKTISVTWSGVFTSVYGSEIRSISARFDENSANIDGKPSLGSDVGSYIITASTTNPNYTLTDNTQQYTITPKPVTVVWSGSFYSIYGAAISSDIAAKFDNNIVATVKDMPSEGANAGFYTLTATTTNNNYLLLDKEKQYEIKPKEVVVVWSGTLSSVFGAAIGDITARFDGQDAEVVGKPAAKADVGKYTLTAVTQSSNYTLTGATQIYEVKKLQREIFWVKDTVYTDKGEIQGPKAFFADVDGKIISLDLEGLGGKVGTFTAQISGTSIENFSNYEFTSQTTNQTYTIVKKPIALLDWLPWVLLAVITAIFVFVLVAVLRKKLNPEEISIKVNNAIGAERDSFKTKEADWYKERSKLLYENKNLSARAESAEKQEKELKKALQQERTDADAARRSWQTEQSSLKQEVAKEKQAAIDAARDLEATKSTYEQEIGKLKQTYSRDLEEGRRIAEEKLAYEAQHSKERLDKVSKEFIAHIESIKNQSAAEIDSLKAGKQSIAEARDANNARLQECFAAISIAIEEIRLVSKVDLESTEIKTGDDIRLRKAYNALKPYKRNY